MDSVASLKRSGSLMAARRSEDVEKTFMKFTCNEPNEVDHMKKLPLTADQNYKKYSSMEANYLEKDSSSCDSDQDQLLKSAKAKMGQVREENKRLKTLLAEIMTDYESLRKQLSTLQEHKSPTEAVSHANHGHDQDINGDDENQLVCLTLGRSSPSQDHEQPAAAHKVNDNEGSLKLGLDCKFDSSSQKRGSADNNSCEESKDEVGQEWPPSKSLKKMRSSEDELAESLQPPLKKTRVSIRARCDSPTINDGCQWRKYGQKISKGNPCPRAYYRCTVSPTCPVRKQVQRCSEDMSILITTYEGNHNHPLPISATAIASATSAAASMLQSGSSSTTTNYNSNANTTLSAGLHGLNFAFANDSPAGKLYLPSPGATTINSHPTITLDLTTPNNGMDTNATNWLGGPSGFSYPASRNYYAPTSSSSTCLNFSSPPSSSSSSYMNSMPTSWASRCLNFGTMSYDTNNINNMHGDQKQKAAGANSNPVLNSLVDHHQRQSMDETISLATRAITSNPKFQSVLAAAISSYVGNKSGNNNAAGMVGDRDGNVDQGNAAGSKKRNLKMEEVFPLKMASPSSKNGGS